MFCLVFPLQRALCAHLFMAHMLPPSIVLAFTNMEVVEEYTSEELRSKIESFLDLVQQHVPDVDIVTIWNSELRKQDNNRNAIASRAFNEGGHDMMTQFDVDDIPHPQVTPSSFVTFSVFLFEHYIICILVTCSDAANT